MGQSARRFRSEWIHPPKSPGKKQLATLCDSFRSRPRIAQAWLVGTRMAPLDGSPPTVATLIGLVLDSPHERERTEALALYDDLIQATGWGRAPDEGWQILTPAEVGEHADEIEMVYSRDTAP